MEDFVIVDGLLQEEQDSVSLPPGHEFFGVLDGHGGTDAADFGSTELTRHLCATQAWQTYVHQVTPYLTSNNKAPPKPKTIHAWNRWLEQAVESVFFAAIEFG